MNLLSEEKDQLLRYIAVMANAYVKKHGISNKKRILIPTSYLHVQFNRIVDFLLAISLKLRGVEIIPILCNGFHTEQCPVWAGAFVKDFFSQCRETCNGPAHILWELILGYKTLRLTSYRMNSDPDIAEKAIAGINYKNYRDYTFQGYAVGAQVAEVVTNNNNLSKLLPDQQYEYELRLHGMNAVQMILAYSRLIKEVQPDSIVGSLHDHYQWSSLYHIARKAGLSYYSHTMVEEPGCIHFGKNVDKVCEVSDAWPSFRKTAVEPKTWQAFDRYMIKKAAGKTTCFSIYPAVGAVEIEKLKSKLDPNKPLAFFPSNVPWDDAIHNYCFVSGDKEIIEMTYKMVRYFNRHPEFQLIIKAHPYEQVFKDFEFLPHTLKRILADMNEPLGSNIHFIDADSPISIFDIYPLVKLGIVHSSRSGCELAMNGVPVILAGDNHYRGKGFTIDVSNESEFYESIQRVLTNSETEETVNNRIKLSKKYWLLYNSHGFVNLGLFSQGWTKPVELLFDSIDDFLPGNNNKLDYICDSIIAGKPIFGESRWPPPSFTDEKLKCKPVECSKIRSNGLYNRGSSAKNQNAVPVPGRNQIIESCNRLNLDAFKAANIKLAQQEYSQGAVHLRSLPQKFVIDISSRCNLSCPLCFTGAGLQKKPAQFMSFGFYKSIIEKIKKYTTWVWLFNWGESLLHPDVVQMIQLASRANISTQISSNLNLKRNDDFWESLIEAPLHQLIVSFDGLEQKTYQKYRVGGKLPLVMQNIKTISNLKRKLNSVFPVVELQFLIHKFNYHEKDKVLQLGRELGADHVYCSELTLPFGCKDSQLAKDWLAPEVLQNWDSYDMDNFMLQGQRCRFLYDFMIIEPDGTIPPCCYTNFPEHDFGIWDEKRTLSEIWNSEKFLNARKLFSGLNNAGGDVVCEKCSAFKHYTTGTNNGKISNNTMAFAPGKRDTSKLHSGDWYTKSFQESSGSGEPSGKIATVKKIKGLLRDGKWQEAQKAVNNGIKVFPDSRKLKNLKIVIDLKGGDVKKGKSRLLEILKLDPDNCETLNILGEIEYQEGNLEDAKEFFKNVLVIDALYQPAKLNLAIVEKSSDNRIR